MLKWAAIMAQPGGSDGQGPAEKKLNCYEMIAGPIRPEIFGLHVCFEHLHSLPNLVSNSIPIFCSKGVGSKPPAQTITTSLRKRSGTPLLSIST